jgi:hypothetical protein
MDLLLIARKIWRHKLLTVPVILLTLAGAVYVVAVKEPLYEASTSYLLISPRPAPTAEEIARNPALAKVRADNPYTRFTDQSVVVDVLERRLSTESARRTLMDAGADPRYTVGSGVEFGSSVPIMQITALAATPEAAIQSAKVVGGAAIAELDRMQKEHDVDPGYRITAMRVEEPDGARLKASGQLRMLVGVLVLGTVLLFIVVSVTDALEGLRRERWAEQIAPERLDELWGDESDLKASNGNGRSADDRQTDRPGDLEEPWAPPLR